MTPSTLRQLGHAVWGQLWRIELARAVGRRVETVRRWGRVGRMSRKDHLRILEAAKLHSKARHKTVLGLVASIKSRPITGCRTYDRRNQVKKAKDPIPPWKNDPQQLVATMEFFANHARPEAFHMKPVEPDLEYKRAAAARHHELAENNKEGWTKIETADPAPMPPQPPLEGRREQKKPGWVVEAGAG